jgi:hypothetical protein
MDRKLQAETLSLLLLCGAFPIISFGAMAGNAWVWGIGLLTLSAGGLLPIITRYMDHTGDTIRDAGMEYDDRTS